MALEKNIAMCNTQLSFIVIYKALILAGNLDDTSKDHAIATMPQKLGIHTHNMGVEYHHLFGCFMAYQPLMVIK